jgi:excisionase family DNA binding protein
MWRTVRSTAHSFTTAGERPSRLGRHRLRLEEGVLLSSGQYLAPRAVAEQLGVTRRTVYAWIQSGALPSFRLSRRARRIREEDLDRFLEARYEGDDAKRQDGAA